MKYKKYHSYLQRHLSKTLVYAVPLLLQKKRKNTSFNSLCRLRPLEAFKLGGDYQFRFKKQYLETPTKEIIVIPEENQNTFYFRSYKRTAKQYIQHLLCPTWLKNAQQVQLCLLYVVSKSKQQLLTVLTICCLLTTCCASCEAKAHSNCFFCFFCFFCFLRSKRSKRSKRSSIKQAHSKYSKQQLLCKKQLLEAKQKKQTKQVGIKKQFNRGNSCKLQLFYVVRPLLSVTRLDTLHICDTLKLPIYPDKSNIQTYFLRNRVRKHLLPAIRILLNPKFDEILCHFNDSINYL